MPSPTGLQLSAFSGSVIDTGYFTSALGAKRLFKKDFPVDKSVCGSIYDLEIVPLLCRFSPKESEVHDAVYVSAPSVVHAVIFICQCPL